MWRRVDRYVVCGGWGCHGDRFAAQQLGPPPPAKSRVRVKVRMKQVPRVGEKRKESSNEIEWNAYPTLFAVNCYTVD